MADGKGSVAYTYKPDGLRLSKNVGTFEGSAGETTTHIWDGSNIVLDLTGSGGIIDVYIRGINLIKSTNNGFYFYNAHGDVTALTNTTGTVTKNYHYDAFGVEVDPIATDSNPFRYCGEYFDKETGTIYLRARYYSPMTGRFTTEDPIHDGLNWYTYCHNNPIVFIDPSGLVEVDMFSYAKTYKDSNITYHDGSGTDNSYYRISWDGKSFDVTLKALFRGTAFCIDDSLFVNAFGVGTNGIIVYEDAATGNVSIRVAFNISGSGADLDLNGITYRALFLAGIEEGWSNETTSAYARENSKGVKVTINNELGISNMRGGFFGWSPSSPGAITMYTGDSRGSGNLYAADQFKIVSAHEFGHTLGIADGYNNATYKYYNSIMCDQWSQYNGTGKASSLDIAKAVSASKTKKWQKWG